MSLDDDSAREFLTTTFRSAYARIKEGAERGENRDTVLREVLASQPNWTTEQEQVWSGFVQTLVNPEQYAQLPSWAQGVVRDILAEVDIKPPGDNDGQHRQRSRRR